MILVADLERGNLWIIVNGTMYCDVGWLCLWEIVWCIKFNGRFGGTTGLSKAHPSSLIQLENLSHLYYSNHPISRNTNRLNLVSINPQIPCHIFWYNCHFHKKFIIITQLKWKILQIKKYLLYFKLRWAKPKYLKIYYVLFP